MIELPHDISSDSYGGASERDLKQTQMNRTAIAFSASAAEEYGFSKETFDIRGKVNAAASKKGDHHNRDYAKHLAAMGEETTWLDAADMKRLSGTDYYVSGLYTPGSAMIQPAGFVRGLARGVESKIDLYENSPVLSLKRKKGLWHVKTPQGMVSVPKIILAVNGHLQSFGFLKRRLMHIFLLCLDDTRSHTPRNRAFGWRTQLGSRTRFDPFGSTVRRIHGVGGDRIIVRNKFDFNSSVEGTDKDVQTAARDHDRSFDARFPMLKGVEMEYRWGGRLCLSWNGVPVFGELEEGIFAACCQNGLGASKGILSGILAAEYASGVENPHITDYLQQAKPTMLPPEPFATVGATAYLYWKEGQAGLEK